MIIAVVMVRNEPTAEASLADMRARIRFGIAIAAMIRMMPTAMSSSIREKPLLLCNVASWDKSPKPS